MGWVVLLQLRSGNSRLRRAALVLRLDVFLSVTADVKQCDRHFPRKLTMGFRSLAQGFCAKVAKGLIANQGVVPLACRCL